MRVLAAFLPAVVLVSVGTAFAQPPTVEKVDPPDWWVNSTINPVRVLVRGKHLSGARVRCLRMTCGRVKVNAAGTYGFVDLTLPPGARAGRYPFTLQTAAGSAEVPFEVTTRLPAQSRYQGFGSDDVIYLIMPDRFANGDASNDEPMVSKGLLDRSKGRYYHGGDLEGVRRQLPYLKELGVTAIWFNPIYDNNNALNRREIYDGQPITDYHGYGAVDFYAVEEHFGDLALLRRLVDEAHGLGIKIILDMVANHTGPYHPWVADSPTPTWYHGTAATHLANDWQVWALADRYSTEAVREKTLNGWFIDILPDLNQEDPEAARYLIQNSLWWVARAGIDGIRQDTWPYVSRRFWRDWMAALKREFPRLTVVGEVFDGDPAVIAFFEGGRVKWDGIDDQVDYLFDFPLYFPLRRAFAEGRPVREVAQMLARDRLYRDPAARVTFLGLHDVPRFVNEPGATASGLKLAFTFLLTTRGIPLIYYGDEIGLPGGGDPDNRRDFPGGWREDPRSAFELMGRTAAEQEIFSHLQTLLRLRAARPGLRGRSMETLVAGEQTLVYRRGETLVALNNDTATVSVRVPVRNLGADLLGGCPAPSAEAGGTVLSLPARTGCLYPVAGRPVPPRQLP
ncbi:MAG: alpha-amylase family glycosyl hydrolase [Gemmatimonadales bacterium]